MLYLQGLWAATVAVAASAPGGRGGEFVVGGALPGYRCYRCRDGQWLFFGAFTGSFIRQGLKALGLSQILSDERLAGDLEAMRDAGNFPWVAGALEQAFRQHDREHWLDVLRAADVPVSPVLAGGTWLDHPQVRALDDLFQGCSGVAF